MLFVKQSLPPIVRRFEWLVFFATFGYALWYDAFVQGRVHLSPDLLLIDRLGWSALWQCCSATVTLPYQGLQLTMIFDLLLLHVFLSPICSFVVSFLSLRNFLFFLVSNVVIGSAFFFLVSALHFTPPSSLFGSVALSIILFWTLLHKKGQASFFTIIPVRPAWSLGIPALLVLLPSLFAENWAKLSASCAMCLWTYFWAVSKKKLRSNVSWLQGLEEKIDLWHTRATTFFCWHVLRRVRSFASFRKRQVHKDSERRT